VTSTSTAEPRPYALLDVFTDVRLTGNALAVVHDADGLADETMRAFARETRLSETTFVQTATEPGADYRNRIFCMAGEMPFAGHPSLGTAVAVARHRGVSGSVTYVQQTCAGLQPIEVVLDKGTASASMLQAPPTFGAELDPGDVLPAAGLSPSDAAPGLPIQIVSTGLEHVIVPVSGVEALGRAFRDGSLTDALLGSLQAWTLYLAASVGDAVFHARAFGQTVQVAEDPATGSAAGPLCAYLFERRGLAAIEIRQGVEMGRPSLLRAAIEDGGVRVGGDVVAVVDGTVLL
jgi:trans-2,3-dihydro-3-hydroxyanthranilate isomerase